MYDLCDIHSADGISLYFNLQPSKTLSFQGHFCHGGTKSKHQNELLLSLHAMKMVVINYRSSKWKLHRRPGYLRVSREYLQNMNLILILG
jgi:hypothetical protein